MRTFWLLVWASFSLCAHTYSQTPLSGSYTIGGAAPDYADFGTAVQALAQQGVAGPVTFRVRTGDYPEQIRIPAITGASVTNRITFESETGDSTDVRLHFDPNWNNNYVVWLDSADHVTLRNLTLEAENNTFSYARAIQLTGGNDSIRLIHNRFIGPTNVNTSNRYALIYSFSGRKTGFLLDGNHFQGGSYGMYLRGSNSIVPDLANRITGNRFDNQRRAGIDLRYNTAPYVAQNTILGPQTTTNFTGILLTNCNGKLRVLRNEAHVLTGGNAIHLSSCNASPDFGLIANNFATVGGNTFASGVAISSSSDQHLLYNSIHCYNTDAISAEALFLEYGSNHTILNNIIVNSGGGYAVYTTSQTSIGYIDHNAYYSTGPLLARYLSQDIANLQEWQSILGQDMNSVEVAPGFVSATDLHVAAVDLDGQAQPQAAVTVDIDGTPRSAGMPDIGADEFDLPAIDAGLTVLAAPQQPFTAGPNPIQVELRNEGTNALSNATLNWTLNGQAQSQVPWTGALTTGQTETVTLGTPDLVAGNEYLLRILVSTPGDLNTQNDTLYSDTLRPALTGIYTIGGVNPDFATFAAAATALQRRGIVDSVRFRVRNGTYDEQIRLSAIPGGGPQNRVTFESESGQRDMVTLTHSANSVDNYTVFLDGAEGITFRNMTLAAGNAFYSNVVLLQNGAHHNAFYNNAITGRPSTNFSTARALINSPASRDTANVFIGNHFTDGNHAIRLLGDFNEAPETGNIIRDNQITGTFLYAIDLSYQDDPEVTGNTITTQSTYFDHAGIRLVSPQGGGRIRRNRLSLASGGTGIYLESQPFNNTRRGIVANNFVHAGGDGTAVGIALLGGSFFDIFSNSVHISSTHPTAGMGIRVEFGSERRFFNNILSNSGGGYAFFYGSFVNQDSLDHNVLHHTGTHIGFFQNPVTDLNAWRTATGQSQNSLAVNPTFTSETDLHTFEIDLNGRARVLPEVPTDIDGEPRDAQTPDIGADEFAVPSNDAGLLSFTQPGDAFLPGTNPVQVRLRNFGAATLSSVAITWSVNGVSQGTVPWTGSLAPGATALVDLGTTPIVNGTAYTFRAWTSMPNGTTDGNLTNDSLQTPQRYAAYRGIFTIGGPSPDFGSFGAAVSALHQGGIVDSVVFNVRNGQYDEFVLIEAIPGASDSSRVIFQAESGNRDSVRVRHSSPSQDEATFFLRGATGITLRNMTIEALNINYGMAVMMKDGATYNRIEGSVLRGVPANNFNDFRAVALMWAGPNHGNQFIGNTVQRGSYGLLTNNAFVQEKERDIVLRDNVFEEQYGKAIDLRGLDHPVIVGNVIDGANAGSSFRGIDLSYCTRGLDIRANRISMPAGGRGIYLNDCVAHTDTHGVIANNFIYAGGTVYSEGIHLDRSHRHDLVFNNIHITNTNSTSTASYFATASGIISRNNVLANTGGGYVHRGISNNRPVSSDHNDLYTTGPILVRLNSNYADLPAWQTLTNDDANSVSLDPRFVTESDLHVREVGLNETGTPFPGITTDIDGEARNPLTPDIGADEFVPSQPDDAGITTIVGPSRPFQPGSQPVTVRLRNSGGDLLSSVTLHWEVNTVAQTPFQWTGSLPPGAETNVVVGNYNFAFGQAHTVTAWSRNPNGNNDPFTANDSASIGNLFPAFSGSYTIGAQPSDFQQLSTTLFALEQGGMTGPVTFQLKSDTFPEQIRIPAINGLTEAQPLVFESLSGDSSDVVIRYRSGGPNLNYTVRLEGARHVTFRNLTLMADDPFYGIVLHIGDESAQNTVTNCRLIGKQALSSSHQNALVYIPEGTLDSANVFRNTHFLYGGQALHLRGEDNNDRAGGTRIQGNIFEDQFELAIYLRYQERFLISGNRIQNSNPARYFRGIWLERCDDGFEIAGNRIDNTGSGTGIFFQSVSGGFNTRAKIYNNFIHVGGSDVVSGLHLYGTSNLDFDYNAVHITSTNANSRALLLDFTNNARHKLRNNIFANTGGGYAAFVQTVAPFDSSDYNAFYSSGPTLAAWGGLRPDLAAWQAHSSLDSHSLEIAPIFFSNSDLHNRQTAFEGAGIPIPGITTDIDGDPRDPQNPDIGADEVTTIPVDVAVMALIAPDSGCNKTASEPVTLRIANFGGTAVSGLTVAYRLNGGPEVRENTGALSIPPGGATADFTFSQHANLSAPGSYTFAAHVELAGDLFPGNDSLAAQVEAYPQLPLGTLDSLLPADNALSVDFPVRFSWNPVTNASSYALFIWQAGTPEPSVPTVAGITAVAHPYTGPLSAGVTYNWKLVAHNNCASRSSSTRTFRIRPQPDLVVESITVPATGVAGAGLGVDWVVRNIGAGGTGSSSWTDQVFLSPDTVLNLSLDTRLGTVTALTALDSGQTYMQSEVFTIPERMSGQFYVIVRTDRYRGITETDENNNDRITASPITINLPDLPDLQAQVLVVPPAAISGTKMEVGWTVENSGNAATGQESWWDEIYLSEDTILNRFNDQLLLRKRIDLDLGVNDSYSRIDSVLLPMAIDGDRFIILQIDGTNRVFEGAFDGNNVRSSDTLELRFVPPPDLVVTDLQFPDSVSNRERAHISWTVTNQGGSATTENSWRDQLFLLPAGGGSGGSLLGFGGDYWHNGNLDIGESYTVDADVDIPASLSGPFRVVAWADRSNRVFEYTFDNNNRLDSQDTLRILNPDIAIEAVTLPDSVTTGQEMIVSWQLRNNGPGRLISPSVTTELHLTPPVPYLPDSAIRMGLRWDAYNLAAGATRTFTDTLTVPDGISGRRFLRVMADIGGFVLEGNEANNEGSRPVWVMRQAAPDLRPLSIDLPDTVMAGQRVPFSFRVRNEGPGDVPASANWNDKLFLSSRSTYTPGYLTFRGIFEQQGPIPRDSTYLVTGLIQLDRNQPPGDWYIYLQVDAEDRLYEHTGENNNRLRSQRIRVIPEPPVEMAVTAFSYSGQARSGAEIQLEWTVTNNGPVASRAGTWYDALYLSTDAQWDPQSDMRIARWQRNGPLLPGANYQANETTRFPNGISGNYYLLLVNDIDDRNADANRGNNVRLPAGTGGSSPLAITLTPPSDLEITASEFPAMGTTGQYGMVRWTVTNNGTGPTAVSNWSDRVYLSSDQLVNGGDRSLAIRRHNGMLAPGASYSDSVEVRFPTVADGTWFLLVATDNFDQNYEHNGEQNNVASAAIALSRPPPSDLQVANVQPPFNATAGDTISLSWELRNTGQNPAIGRMYEGVYFSADSTWDPGDRLLGTRSTRIAIDTNESVVHTLSGQVPGLADGDYFILVRTDIRQNIPESREDNNTTISLWPVNVSVATVPLGTTVPEDLYNDREYFYKVDVHDSLDGETLLFTVDSGDPNGENEIYHRSAVMPSRAAFTYTHRDPFRPDQEVLVPNLTGGPEYFLVYGNTLPADSQAILLSSGIVPLEIREIETAEGGNTGPVTVRLFGSKFQPDMVVRLERGGDTILASTPWFADPATAYVTFDLFGAALGPWDVVIELQDGDMTRLANGFRVVPGAGEQLVTYIQHPSAARTSSPFVMTVQVANGGNTDLPIPRLDLESITGAALGRSPTDLQLQLRQLALAFPEYGGPPHVLRPGASSSVTVYAASAAEGLRTFRLYK